MLQLTGINGLKAAGGNFAFNSGAFDSVSKVYFLAPAPTQGLLKMFTMPPTGLRPEPWVPATVASYQSLSWDLDKAYDALNELVNQFQPGMLQLLQQQLVGPNGGDPIDLQKDVFGPLGDRLTLISDFKKPVKEDSQRLLLGIALEDSKKFQGTLNKVIEIAGGAPEKRDFQGTTIYDFKLPEMPAPAAGAPNNNPFKGARPAWRSPRTPSSSPPTRPSWRPSSAVAGRAWPTTPTSRPSPSRSRPRAAR